MGSAGGHTGSYRIPVFIFLMICIFKIPQCHLNNVRNATRVSFHHCILARIQLYVLLSVKVPKLKH